MSSEEKKIPCSEMSCILNSNKINTFDKRLKNNLTCGLGYQTALFGLQKYFKDKFTGTNWLATGKFPVCHLCREIDKAAQQGLPVEDIPPEKLKEGGTIGGGGSSVLALINRAPHPNTAKVFVNWYLSRQGQTVWQNVMNKKEVEASDSMRIDIPKDKVAAPARREEGKKYIVTGFLDPDPPTKLFKELMSKDRRK